jgi:hypothetical protein
MSDRDVSKVLNRWPNLLDLSLVTVNWVFQPDGPLSKREEYRSAGREENETGRTVHNQGQNPFNNEGGLHCRATYRSRRPLFLKPGEEDKDQGFETAEPKMNRPD